MYIHICIYIYVYTYMYTCNDNVYHDSEYSDNEYNDNKIWQEGTISGNGGSHLVQDPFLRVLVAEETAFWLVMELYPGTLWSKSWIEERIIWWVNLIMAN